MHARPGTGDYGAFYEGYIRLVPEGNLIDILRKQGQETLGLLEEITEEQSRFAYAPGKWTIKEMIGHLGDAERIMSYRLLRTARGDQTPLAGFEEDSYVQEAAFDRLPFAKWRNDWRLIRESTVALLEGLADEVWDRRCVMNGVETTALAVACIIAGHERHHLNVLHERYLNG